MKQFYINALLGAKTQNQKGRILHAAAMARALNDDDYKDVCMAVKLGISTNQFTACNR